MQYGPLVNNSVHNITSCDDDNNYYIYHFVSGSFFLVGVVGSLLVPSNFISATTNH